MHIFVKGADLAIFPVCVSDDGATASTQKEVDEMATQGLRTLVYGHGQIGSERFAKYVHDLENTNCSFVDRYVMNDFMTFPPPDISSPVTSHLTICPPPHEKNLLTSHPPFQ